MSADELTRQAISQIEKEKYALIVMNYANPDLVGHGGKIQAAVEACETVDRNLAMILPILEKHGYEWVITADHGNAEEMLVPGTDTVSPSHTTNQIQTFVHSRRAPSIADLHDCKTLKDIAPLVLRMMDLPVPQEMG
jgi:2,3-bisphosphoglycerate-independent phosphoglycerate mutase